MMPKIGNVESWDREHLWRFRARPLEVTDGDTFWALTDNGHSLRAETSIRIRGYSAAESWEDDGLAATVALYQALQPDVLYRRKDWPLRVISVQRETVVSEVRSFIRYVSDVYVVRPDGTAVDLVELLREVSP